MAATGRVSVLKTGTDDFGWCITVAQAAESMVSALALILDGEW